jgi:hypothetical protein
MWLAERLQLPAIRGTLLPWFSVALLGSCNLSQELFFSAAAVASNNKQRSTACDKQEGASATALACGAGARH